MRIWTYLSRLMIGLIVIAVLVGIALWYLPLIRQNQRMRAVERKLERQIEHQEEIKRDLEAEIRALETNPAAIERAAREQLGFVKPGETMIRFEPRSTQESDN